MVKTKPRRDPCIIDTMACYIPPKTDISQGQLVQTIVGRLPLVTFRILDIHKE